MHRLRRGWAERHAEADVASRVLWVRRIAMLHQLGWKQHTDVQRLLAYALALGHEDEFFIRKAIGWALRDLARTQPETVRQFVLASASGLSALTVREATKHF